MNAFKTGKQMIRMFLIQVVFLSIIFPNPIKVASVSLPTPNNEVVANNNTAELIQQGGFESINPWNVWTYSGNVAPVIQSDFVYSGNFALKLGGYNNQTQNVYQTVTIPSWLARGEVSFWIRINAPVMDPGSDVLCLRLFTQLPTDFTQDTGLVDLGCVTGAYQSEKWRVMSYQLYGSNLDRLRGQQVYFYFHFENRGEYPTTVWVDDISFIVNGETNDPYEPNDSPGTAERLTSGDNVTDLTINPDHDVDWFVIACQAGQYLNVLATTIGIGSSLHAQIIIYSHQLQMLISSNEYEPATDTQLSVSIPSSGDYYIQIQSYDGFGNLQNKYQLSVNLTGNSSSAKISDEVNGQQNYGINIPEITANSKEWTLMLYYNFDNNYGDNFWMFTSYMLAYSALTIGKGDIVNIVVQKDDSHSDYTSRYQINPGGLPTQFVMPKTHMDSGQALINFVNWAKTNYPAQHYFLDIMGHGGGTGGISYSRSDNMDSIGVRELYDAMRRVTNAGQQKIDVLFLDACTMNSYEEAYDMSFFANYLVSSQATITHTSYSFLLDLLSGFHSGMSELEFGTMLVDSIASVSAIFPNNPLTISLIDLSKMRQVHNAINDFFLVYGYCNYGPTVQACKQVRNSSQLFGPLETNGNGLTSPFVDLYDLTNNLMNAHPDDPWVQYYGPILKSAISSAVLINFVTPTNCNVKQPFCYSHAHGMSIFWPYGIDQYLADWYINIGFTKGLYQTNLYAAGVYNFFLEGVFYPYIPSSTGSDMITETKSASTWWQSSPGLPVDPGGTARILNQIHLPIVSKRMSQIVTTVEGQTTDGEVLYLNCLVWSTCRNAATGNANWQDLGVGTVGAGYTAPYYFIQRIFLFFDTTSIPSGANITSVVLHMFAGQYQNGTKIFHVVPSTATIPLSTTDFGKISFVTGGAATPTSLNSWVSINFTPTALTWITKGGLTKVALLNEYDVYNVIPTTTNDITVGLTEDVPHRPYLEITYSMP